VSLTALGVQLETGHCLDFVDNAVMMGISSLFNFNGEN
jgi:hypothetical protein